MGTPSTLPAGTSQDIGAEKSLQRRLAAIVFADVAGYSRLMHDDESGTINTLKKHLSELIEPVIAEQSGRLVKTTGDGILMEFSSAVSAVTAAIDIQRGMMLRNNQTPEDRRIEFRIGINLSEIVVDDADILGDGVNVAARLEELADANGICVSDEIQRIVRNKIDADIESVGEVSLKNMPRPIKVYRISMEGQHANGAGKDHKPLAKTTTAEPLLAVLPFANLSHDQDQTYFSDGVTNDIISNLSRFPEIGIIASHSVFAYKSRPTGIATVAEDLGVRYVVEGNVQRSQSIVRINVQLIDAHADRQLWSDRFQGDPNEIFEMQEEITRAIAARVVSRVGIAERGRSCARRRTIWRPMISCCAASASGTSGRWKPIAKRKSFSPRRLLSIRTMPARTAPIRIPCSRPASAAGRQIPTRNCARPTSMRRSRSPSRPSTSMPMRNSALRACICASSTAASTAITGP